jgi:uncharacterized damage-inducible protein DinB
MPVARTDPPVAADERAMLVAWLDWHRATLAMKCDGLEPSQLRTRAVPPATLSLLGLVRHMAEVERNWFRRVFRGEDAPAYFYSESNPDGEFDDVDAADVDEAFRVWNLECDYARTVVAETDSLDALAVTPRRSGALVSLRWILVHMIEEYARHNGHADLLRQCIDGAVGL